MGRLTGSMNAGVMADMLDRDLSKFKPNSTAPETPYLQEMRKLADRPMSDYVREQFAQGIHPFGRDIISVSELYDWVQRNTKVKVTRQNELANALKDIGGVLKPGCPVKDLGDYVNLWVIRNHDKYKNLTAKEIGAKYVPFYSGQF